MKIQDTINSLKEVHQFLEQGVPQTITSPDALVAYLNDLYLQFSDNSEFDELFAYSDVGNPSLTMSVSIEAEFDVAPVVKALRVQFQIPTPRKTDEIGNAGVVWSHGRYDFVYDVTDELLHISHPYSHERSDTQSVLSISIKMLDYALCYLAEVIGTSEECTDTSEPEIQ